MNPPGYEQNEYATHPEYAHIIGVFREQAQAIEAVDELKEASFPEDHIRLTSYEPPDADQAEGTPVQASGRRFFVHVDAPGAEEKAVGILAHHGANNADLPPGTDLVNGKLVYTNARATAERPTSSPAASAGLFDPAHSGSSATDSIANERGI